MVASRIRIARDKQNQADFAAALGIGPRLLSAYERGEREVPEELLQKIAELTSHDLEWLAARIGSRAGKSAAPPSGRRGQRTKITPALIDRICTLIRRGSFAAPAARAVGIGESTYWHWRRMGDDARAKLDLGQTLSDQDECYLAFRDALDIADAEAETAMASMLSGHAALSPTAAVEVLARRWPERWSPKQRIEHEVKTTGAPSIPVKNLSMEQLKQLEGLVMVAMEADKPPAPAAEGPAGAPPEEPAEEAPEPVPPGSEGPAGAP